VTLVELQEAFRDLRPDGPVWPWERKLLQLILKSENGFEAFDVLQAVVENPERVSRILSFLGDQDIYRVKALAAVVQPATEDLRLSVDLMNAWVVRQTVKKMLAGKQAE
jgi:hypothetical protein